MLFKTKSRAMRVDSILAKEAHSMHQKWLLNIDECIKKNLNSLTCEDIRGIYIALFGELKYWRSNSSGFTGFSEFLIFRTLFHTIGEKFERIETGDIVRDPIVFRSNNYEIGQGIHIQLDGLSRIPDIYVKKDEELLGIIQIKTGLYGGEKEIVKEIKTFRLIKSQYPFVKGLFVIFGSEAYSEKKGKILSNAGFQVLVLQENSEPIFQILREFISTQESHNTFFGDKIAVKSNTQEPYSSIKENNSEQKIEADKAETSFRSCKTHLNNYGDVFFENSIKKIKENLVLKKGFYLCEYAAEKKAIICKYLKAESEPIKDFSSAKISFPLMALSDNQYLIKLFCAGNNFYHHKNASIRLCKFLGIKIDDTLNFRIEGNETLIISKAP